MTAIDMRKSSSKRGKLRPVVQTKMILYYKMIYKRYVTDKKAMELMILICGRRQQRRNQNEEPKKQ